MPVMFLRVEITQLVHHLSLSLAELSQLVESLPQAKKVYPSALLTSLQGPRRFPDGYKNQTPYNMLTMLDPIDIYFSTEQANKAFEDLASDVVYDSLLLEDNNVAPVAVPSTPALPQNASSFETRRLVSMRGKALTPYGTPYPIHL